MNAAPFTPAPSPEEILNGYSDPGLSLNDLAAAHQISLRQLLTIIVSDEFQSLLNDVERADARRAAHIHANAAIRALAHVATGEAPATERRRAAAPLLNYLARASGRSAARNVRTSDANEPAAGKPPSSDDRGSAQSGAPPSLPPDDFVDPQPSHPPDAPAVPCTSHDPPQSAAQGTPSLRQPSLAEVANGRSDQPRAALPTPNEAAPVSTRPSVFPSERPAPVREHDFTAFDDASNLFPPVPSSALSLCLCAGSTFPSPRPP